MGHPTVVRVMYPKTKTATLNLAQAAATYDALTASAALIIESVCFYVATAGATFDSVAVVTNQTNPVTFLTALEGAVANIIAQKTLAFAYARFPVYLAAGQKIQYTIVGATGTGSVLMVVTYRPAVDGTDATLA